MLYIFERFVHFLSWRAAQLAQLAMVIVMGITVINIIIRIPFRPIGGAVELVEMFGAIMLGFGVAYTALVKGHIMVGILVDRFSPRIQGVIEAIVNVIAFFFSYILAREILLFAYDRMEAGYVTGHLDIPIAPSIYLVGAGFVIFCLVILLQLIKAIITVIKGSET